MAYRSTFDPFSNVKRTSMALVAGEST